MLSKTIKTLPFIFVFLLFFIAPRDPDLGWHLRYGDYFLTNGQILRENQLTYFLSDYSWVHTDSLYQVAVALTNKISGFLGLSLFYSLLMTLSYLLFIKINPKISKFSLLLFPIMIFLSWPGFGLGIRSQIFTFIYLLIYFVLLKYSEEKPKLLFVIVLVMLAWVNTHGGFFLGLVLVTLSLLSALFSKKYSSANKLLLTLLSTLLISLINPFGIKIYQWIFIHSQVPLKNLIAEWVPPPSDLSLIILIVSTLLFCLILLRSFKDKKSGNLFWLLSLAFFTFLAFSSRRNLPLWALTASLSSLELWQDKIETIENHPYFKKAFYSLLLLSILPLLMFKLSTTFKMATNWDYYCQKAIVVYPCLAIDFIRNNQLQAKNIFNAYEWGGLLEWQLPEYKFFVDGRMPAWPTPEGKSPYSIYLEILQTQPGYQEKLDQYKTDALLIQVNTFMDVELREKKDSPWQEIYRDKVAVIYTRR